MTTLLLLAAAAAQPAAPAAQMVTPRIVSPLTVQAQPKTPPPADAAVTVDSGDTGLDPMGVTVFPTHAWERGAGGQVTLTCLIDAHGIAERCRVAYEAPQGQGLGAAALEMQPLLKIAPRKGADGAPLASEMNIALTFKPPIEDSNVDGFMKANAAGRFHSGIPDFPVGEDLRLTHNLLAMRHIVMLNHPVWASAASFEDLARAYPAAAGGTEGFAVDHCQVRRDGKLIHCFVAREQPTGDGFGVAALKLAARFRVAPETMRYAPHGDPVEVDIPIRFLAPGEMAGREVSAPVWLSGVDPATTPRLFPPEAAAQGLTTGRGVARCEVAADGSLTGCVPELGDPDGFGFSQAAVRLAATLRMNLWGADAAPVVGGVARVPIRLNLAAPAPSATP
jgi:hypothetical protein